jgi:putative oxidoreductase
MSLITSAQRVAAMGKKATDSLAFLAPLATRLVLGPAFFLTGRGKLVNFENTTGFFTQLGIPFPAANAAFVASLEMVGGILLMLGLGTRIVALLLSSTMVVALLTADRQSFLEGLGGGDVTGVTPAVFLLFLLWLMLYGPGNVSLDWIIGRRFRRPESKTEPDGVLRAEFGSR